MTESPAGMPAGIYSYQHKIINMKQLFLVCMTTVCLLSFQTIQGQQVVPAQGAQMIPAKKNANDSCTTGWHRFPRTLFLPMH